MNEQIKKMVDGLRERVKGEYRVNSLYKPTIEELNNIVYLLYRYTINQDMRLQDFWIPWLCTPEVQTTGEISKHFIPILASYVKATAFSNIEEIGVDDIVYAAELVKDFIYSTMSQQERQDVGASPLDQEWLTPAQYVKQVVDEVTAKEPIKHSTDGNFHVSSDLAAQIWRPVFDSLPAPIQQAIDKTITSFIDGLTGATSIWTLQHTIHGFMKRHYRGSAKRLEKMVQDVMTSIDQTLGKIAKGAMVGLFEVRKLPEQYIRPYLTNLLTSMFVRLQQDQGKDFMEPHLLRIRALLDSHGIALEDIFG